ALELTDRAAVGLCLGALDHPIDQRFRELRCLELRPGPLQAGTELAQHVAHAGLAARKVIDEVGPHSRPAKARAVNDGVVELAGGGHAVIDEVQDLPPQRFLEAIRQMPGYLAPDAKGMHTDPGIDYTEIGMHPLRV